MRSGAGIAHCGPIHSEPISIGTMSSRDAAIQSRSAISRTATYAAAATPGSTERTASGSMGCS